MISFIIVEKILHEFKTNVWYLHDFSLFVEIHIDIWPRSAADSAVSQLYEACSYIFSGLFRLVGLVGSTK